MLSQKLQKQSTWKFSTIWGPRNLYPGGPLSQRCCHSIFHCHAICHWYHSDPWVQFPIRIVTMALYLVPFPSHIGRKSQFSQTPSIRLSIWGSRWSILIPFGMEQEVKVIWQKAPHGGLIPRLGVTPGGRKLYHWIPGVGFPISVP